MSLKNKAFIAIFSTIILVILAFSAFIHSRMDRVLEEQYFDRYKNLNFLLGKTIVEIEKKVEATSLNALYYLRDRVKKNGIPNDSELRKLSKMLDVSHFYITDHKGNFIRNTDTPAEDHPNIFGYCYKYPRLIEGHEKIVVTPIMLSDPNQEPFKFISIADGDRKHILEVGVHMKVISAILNNALENDSDIVGLGLFAPTGQNLGYINRERGLEFNAEPLDYTYDDLHELHDGRAYIQSRIDAIYRSCCDCKALGSTSNGDNYYYFIRTTTSAAGLLKAKNQLVIALSVFIGIALGLTWFISKWLAIKLVGPIEEVAKAMDKISELGNFHGKLKVPGSSEIARLCDHFNKMMETLELQRHKVVQIERAQSKAVIASQVAHDIRSPITALEIALGDDQITSDRKALVNAALRRIKDICNNLLKDYKSQETKPLEACDIHLPSLIEGILLEKETIAQNSNAPLIKRDYGGNLDYYINGSSSEFKRVISNILDNALRFTPPNEHVAVSLGLQNNVVHLKISDCGPGFQSDVVKRIRKGERISTTGGHGLGLTHATSTIERYGGSIDFYSRETRGSTVEICMRAENAPSWALSKLIVAKGTTIVIMDDDPSAHQIWDRKCMNINGLKLEHCYEFNQAIINNHNPRFLIIDYEIKNCTTNGIDFIANNKLQNIAVLVTHHFEDPNIREECIRLGIKLFPKLLVYQMNIEIKEFDESLDSIFPQ